jgi:hypothetical protein
MDEDTSYKTNQDGRRSSRCVMGTVVPIEGCSKHTTRFFGGGRVD